MALGSHWLVLRVWTGTGGPSTLGMVTDYQPSVPPTYGRLPGLTMLRVYPVNCGNKLHGVIYVPGLKRRLFSVTAFASRGHYAIVKKIKIQLMFGQEERPLTLMLKNGMPVANNATVKQLTIVP